MSLVASDALRTHHAVMHTDLWNLTHYNVNRERCGHDPQSSSTFHTVIYIITENSNNQDGEFGGCVDKRFTHATVRVKSTSIYKVEKVQINE